MIEILKLVQAGKISTIDAEKEIRKVQLSYELPTAVCSVHPDLGVQIELYNWEGVSMGRMEQMYHRMVVATQQYRAKRLLEMRQQEKQNAA